MLLAVPVGENRRSGGSDTARHAPPEEGPALTTETLLVAALEPTVAR